MPNLKDLRELLTDRSSIKGKVEWFGDWIECLADRFSDTEVRLQGLQGAKLAEGDLIILKGLGFPFDGVHSVGEGMTIAFSQSHEVEEEVELKVGLWRSWNVYDSQALTTGMFTRLQQIQYVDRKVLEDRPQVRAQEQAVIASQAQSLISIASELDGLDTSVAMAQLSAFLADPNPEQLDFTIAQLVEPNSLALAAVADRLRAGDYAINQKTVQMAVLKELMPRLEAIGNLDFSVLHRLQEMQRDNAIAEIADDQDFIELISEEGALMCMMPINLLSSHAAISRRLQTAVIELYKEISEIAAKKIENQPEGKPPKVAPRKSTRNSGTAS